MQNEIICKIGSIGFDRIASRTNIDDVLHCVKMYCYLEIKRNWVSVEVYGDLEIEFRLINGKIIKIRKHE